MSQRYEHPGHEPTLARLPVAEAANPAPAARERKPAWRSVNVFLLTAAAIVIVIAGMRAAAEILMPFLLALFIAVICTPLYQSMRRRHVPTSLAVAAILLLMMGGVLVVVGVVERALTALTGNLPAYQAAFVASTDQLWGWLEELGLELPEATLNEYLNVQVLLRYLGTVAATLRDFLSTMFIIVIVAIFILLESSALPAKVRDLPVLSQDTWARLQQIAADVRRYMLLKTVMSLLTGALIALFSLIVGVDFAILLGVLAFALNYIPVIGSIVAALPGILLAFVEFGLGTSVLVTVGYVAINIGVSNGIEPRYFGDGLNLSPLVVILSVLLWGWVLGPMGMLLSVPLTMSVKIALESDEGTEWLALLMSGRRSHTLREAAHQLAAKVRPHSH
jgi:predicted PurR-regulated permease PerM